MPADTPSLERIATLRFRRRKESWVAESAGRFYKIIRKSDDPLHDLDDPMCIETAMREYTDMRYLCALGTGICRPERIDRACIVYPFLSGPDMRTSLLRSRSPGEREPPLRSVMRLLARLHQGDSAGYPVKDYRHDNFLAPTPELLDWMQGRRRTLIVTGFEARNFRFDQSRNAWFFFDPHHVWRGFPEEDFARFMVSLLMIRGRRSGPWPWTNFDRFGLLATYESFTHAKLDRRLLNYFLAERLAMRRCHAMRSVRRILTVSRPLGVAYTRFYYHRLRRALASRQF